MRYCDLKYTLGFGSTEHSGIRLGTSLLYRDTDIGLVDATNHTQFPCQLTTGYARSPALLNSSSAKAATVANSVFVWLQHCFMFVRSTDGKVHVLGVERGG